MRRGYSLPTNIAVAGLAGNGAPGILNASTRREHRAVSTVSQV